MHRAYLVLSAILLLVTLSANAQTGSQTIDPYRRLNDPLAIADLSGPDTAGLQSLIVVGPTGPTEPDGFREVAVDTGSGIIRHVWCTYSYGHANPDARVKIWIDDSLVVLTSAEGLFKLQQPPFQPPFDTAIAGGNVCEIQMPYHRSFRITFKGDWAFFGVIWQHLPEPLLPRLDDPQFLLKQKTAEANYWSPGAGSTGIQIVGSRTLATGDSMVLVDQSGPSWIEDLHIGASSYDTSALKDLWLCCYWDHNPTPAVEVPVADFFGARVGLRTLHSIRLVADSARGFDCYFPMPFRYHGRVVLRQKGAIPVTISAVAEVAPLPSSSAEHVGYFTAQFNRSDYLPIRSLHQLAHVKGQGRYVGTMIQMPSYPVANFMEGDVFLIPDSASLDSPNSIHYIGTEDYCNGGWYFLDSAFSLPFCGNPHRWTSMYRFHWFDAVEFQHAFDGQIGHGFSDDYSTEYNSVSYLYVKPTPFWISADTVAPGATLTIGGAGFPSDTLISIQLGSLSLYSTRSASDGTFTASLPVTSSWPRGAQKLFVNGASIPQSLWVLDQPAIDFVHDSTNQVKEWRDSILIHGYGFAPHEHLRAFLGDSLLIVSNGYPLDAGTSGTFVAKVFVPWLPADIDTLSVQRSDGSRISARDPIQLSRVLDYEFEELPVTEGIANPGYVGWVATRYHQQSVRFCYADAPGSHLQLSFDVPESDTFMVRLFAAAGVRYGRWRMFIDNIDCGSHDWFVQGPWGLENQQWTDAGPIALRKGSHTIRFVNEGHTDGAAEYSLAPDAFTLSPIGSSTSKVTNEAPVTTLHLFPNPDAGDVISFQIPQSLDDLALSAQIVDLLGRPVAATYHFHSSSGSTVSLPLPKLAEGSYYVTISSASSSRRQNVTLPFSRTSQ